MYLRFFSMGYFSGCVPHGIALLNKTPLTKNELFLSVAKMIGGNYQATKLEAIAADIN
jgi:hypothetical protein